MNAFEELMNNRWIIKSNDKEKYYRIKDGLTELKPFFQEKLGYRVVVNPYVIKVEKLPGQPLPWMGIMDFADPHDYSFLCLILMFLEDKETEEQFVLSQLTEFVSSNFVGDGADWTVFSNRRKLVRVIKFCIKNSLFLVDDGDEEGFSQSAETEALFENTGLSRYFMRSFIRDISDFSKAEDFYATEWVGIDEERGIVRRQRVYRKLLLSMGVYRDGENEEDFAYIKNGRGRIETDLNEVTDCSLHLHRNSAFVIVGSEGDLGKPFPSPNTLSEAILLFHGILTEAVKEGKAAINLFEQIDLAWQELEDMAVLCFERYSRGFSKGFREMSGENFAKDMIEEMEKLGIIDVDTLTGRCIVYPIVGKIVGSYPSDFAEKTVADYAAAVGENAAASSTAEAVEKTAASSNTDFERKENNVSE